MYKFNTKCKEVNFLTSRAIIFDMDGTLFDSKKMLTGFISEALTKLTEEGILEKEKWENEPLSSFIGLTPDTIFAKILPGADEETIGSTVGLLSEMQKNYPAGEAELFPGVKETIEKLYKQGHDLYVASNGPAGYVPRVLREFGMEEYFKGMSAAGSHHTKSKVELLSLVLEENDINGSALMVGDRHSDIEAGQKCNIETVGCTYGFGDLEEINEATYLIDYFPKLLEIV